MQPHPHAACPDTRLEIDAAPPEAAAVSRTERPPTVLDIPNLDNWSPLAAQNPLTGVDLGRPGAIHANGPGIALQRCTGPGSTHLTPDAGVNNVLPLFMNKERRDGNINRRSRNNSLSSPEQSAKDARLSPWKLAHTEGIPGLPTPVVLCGILAHGYEKKVVQLPGKPTTAHTGQKKVSYSPELAVSPALSLTHS